jgi:hypothetical protein
MVNKIREEREPFIDNKNLKLFMNGLEHKDLELLVFQHSTLTKFFIYWKKWDIL